MTDDHTDLLPRFWNDVCQGTLEEDAMRAIAKHGCQSYAGPHLAVSYRGAMEMMFKWGDECIIPYLVEEIGADIPYDPIQVNYGRWCCDVVCTAVQHLCIQWVDEADYEDNDFDLPEPSELTEWMEYDVDC